MIPADTAKETNRTGRLSPVLSLIVPTYLEAATLPAMIERVDGVRRAHGLDVELIIVDDYSRDGTDEAVRAAGADWVRLVIHKPPRDAPPKN